MSRTHRHIKSLYNIINEVSYAILQEPTHAAVKTEKTMETNEETKDIRQAGKTLYVESELAEDKETKGQKKTQGTYSIMENEAVGYDETYV